MIGEGRSALQTAARTMIGGGLICIGRLHFDLRNLNGQIGTSFGNLLAWLAPGSQILYFLGIFFRFGHFNLVCYEEICEGDGANRAGVIGLIRQGFASVGLEADQPDCDRVSSDQGFLIGRSGCDRSDQGQLRSNIYLHHGGRLSPENHYSRDSNCSFGRISICTVGRSQKDKGTKMGDESKNFSDFDNPPSGQAPT